MHIELTGEAQQLVEKLLAQGRFRSADEAVECALEFFRDCQPTMDSLNAKLQEGLADAQSGRVTTFESDDELKTFFERVKRQGRDRMAENNNP